MEYPSYIAKNQDELFDKSPTDIQQMIVGEEVGAATATLGQLHKIPVVSLPYLDDLISFTLIGALQPDHVVQALKDVLKLPEEEAYKVAQDMEKSILEKARIKILQKAPAEMVTLTFQEGRSPDELRKEILDTTKRPSVFTDQDIIKQAHVEAQTKSVPTVAQAGSRTQLLEQLQLLGTIPNDVEVEERLKKIQEQISGMKKQETPPNEEINLPPPEEVKVAEPEARPATYSKAPTKYNVDPYREVAEE